MSTELFSLKGRTALITGSSRGIGFAIAKAYLNAGARVVLNGTDAARLSTAAALLREGGNSVTELPFDVTDETALLAAMKSLDDRGITVDVLVNNAGIQFRKPMVELETRDWQRVIDTNLTSAFMLGREVAKRMIARGQGGKIVNIASLTSAAARPTVAPYTAAKGGIRLLTCSMAAEWAQHNIQANAIGPGYIATEMNTALINNPQFDAWVKDRTPAGRWGQPDELVGAAIFLASQASNFVNGHLLFVDGGFMAAL